MVLVSKISSPAVCKFESLFVDAVHRKLWTSIYMISVEICSKKMKAIDIGVYQLMRSERDEPQMKGI